MARRGVGPRAAAAAVPGVRSARGDAAARIVGREPWVLETGRLRLRQWREDDLEPYVALLSRTRDTLRSPAMPRIRVEALNLDFCWQWSGHGVGPFAVLDRATGEWLGEAGLSIVAGESPSTAAELGFRLHGHARDRGLATEAALACLHFGFDVVGLRRVVAAAEPAGAPALRVLEKLGMPRVGVDRARGVELVWHAMDSAAWRARSTTRDNR